MFQFSFWLTVILGLVLTIVSNQQRSLEPLPRADEANTIQVVKDYVSYRNLSLQASFANSSLDNATLSSTDVGMNTPTGVVSQMYDGTLYVYASLSDSQYVEAKNMLEGTYAIGRNVSGVWNNGLGGGVVLPSFVPDQSVVSVIKVR